MIKRLEKLIENIKIARSKANNVEVGNVKLGQRIFDFIHKDVI